MEHVFIIQNNPGVAQVVTASLADIEAEIYQAMEDVAPGQSVHIRVRVVAESGPATDWMPRKTKAEPPPLGAVTSRYVLANIGQDGRVDGYVPFIDGIPPATTRKRGWLAILDHGLIVGWREWVTE